MGHPVRVAILEFLIKQNCCFFGELHEVLPISKATVSQHLMTVGITVLSVILLFDKKGWGESCMGLGLVWFCQTDFAVISCRCTCGRIPVRLDSRRYSYGWHHSKQLGGMGCRGNSLLANFLAGFTGAFMYFATLTEVPIIQGLLASGMGKGPALALLLAGPSLSLPNMLVIRGVLRTKKTVVYVVLVIVMATLSGFVFGNFFKATILRKAYFVRIAYLRATDRLLANTRFS